MPKEANDDEDQQDLELAALQRQVAVSHQGVLDLAERQRQRREFHNMAERRRREYDGLIDRQRREFDDLAESQLVRQAQENLAQLQRQLQLQRQERQERQELTQRQQRERQEFQQRDGNPSDQESSMGDASISSALTTVGSKQPAFRGNTPDDFPARPERDASANGSSGGDRG